MRVYNEYPHRMADRRREESVLSGKRLNGRLYGTNVPNTERKRSALEGRIRSENFKRISGGDAPGGHTRSHPEHDG